MKFLLLIMCEKGFQANSKFLLLSVCLFNENIGEDSVYFKTNGVLVSFQ